MFFIKLILGCLVAFICGVFGAYGGAKNKAIRRYGISILLTIIVTSALVIKFGWIGLVGLTVMALAGTLSLGYGIPDEYDEGSALGRFWLKRFDTHWEANFYTRLTIAVLHCLCFLSIPILTTAWIFYTCACMAGIFLYLIFSTTIENEGMIKIGDIDFLLEEFFIYFGFMGVFVILAFFI